MKVCERARFEHDKKLIHTDSPGYLVFLSPVTFPLFVFVLLAIIVPQHNDENLGINIRGL